MNFNSVFEELSNLYEEKTSDKIAFMDLTGSSSVFERAYERRIKEDGFVGSVRAISDTLMKDLQAAVNSGADVTLYTCDDDYKTNCPDIVNKKNFKVVQIEPKEVKEGCAKKTLKEANEDEIEIEIVDDEPATAETADDEIAFAEEPVETLPRQLILECEKCGAIIIRAEADVVIDEEAGLANLDVACDFCEETEGYTIIGVVAPYEAADVDVDNEESTTDEPTAEAAEEAEEAEEVAEEPVEEVVED